MRLTKAALIGKLEADGRVADLEAAAHLQLAEEGLVPDLTVQRATALAKNIADQLASEKKQLSSLRNSETAPPHQCAGSSA